MKVSLNTIRIVNQKYGSAGDPAPDGVEKLAERIGAQLGAIEEVIDIGSKYDGALIVKVVACDDHPNADRLHFCTIDDGGKIQNIERDAKGLIQVVCGAPNVHAGMLAVWLPPGMIVPSTVNKNPFKLEVREIRGVKSNGMLASPKELAIGDLHEGILEVDKDAAPGTGFVEAYGLVGEVVVDIENKMFTHRPDCFGFIGVAREIAGIKQQAFKSPGWYVPDPKFPAVEAEPLKLEVKNEIPELVPRFTAIAMSNVEIKPSPVWLQIFLSEMGVHSINNIVDYSNYLMLETGQPIHIYDYDKVLAQSSDKTARLTVRHPKQGEKIALLNGKTIEPSNDTMMVATDKALAGLGGAMGGAETEVGAETKNIIVEAATWDMFQMRRTSMEYGIFTDAVTRFTKGQSPLQNKAVVAKIVNEIRENAGGKVASELIDDNHVPKEVMERGSVHPPVMITPEFINARLGLKLSADEIKVLLTNVEFDAQTSEENLVITAPFWRTDIEIPEDVVEEVGRLYGYDKLPLELPKRDLTPARKDPLIELKSKLRENLSSAGANEVLTYSFVHGNLLDKAGQYKTQAFRLSNALSPDLQYYRLSLTPSLLEKIHPNIKLGYDAFALFEIGKAHSKNLADEDGLPKEFERAAFVFAAGTKAAANYQGAPFYQAKKYLLNLLHDFGIAARVRFGPFDAADPDQAARYYETGRSATIKCDDAIIGRIGEYKTSVRKALKLPDFCAGFELGLAPLMKYVDERKYTPLPKFPKLTQDITLKIPADTAYQSLYDFAWKTIVENQPDNASLSLTPIDIYQRDGSSDKHITMRLTIASYERTLTDSEVIKLLDRVAAASEKKLGAERV